MSKVLKTVKIEDILPNPWRDFDLYPIGEEQVARLVASMTSMDFWIGQGRSAPGQPGKIQLGAGHHRLEAEKRRGVSTIDMEIEDYTDDEMLMLMMLENATQRYNSAALTDSVNAIVKRIAWKLYAEQNLTAEFCSENSRYQGGQARDGIGRDLISAESHGNLTDKEIEIALAALKASGHYTRAVEGAIAEGQRRAQERLAEIERQRQEAEERALREAEEAERRRAAAEEQAERDRIAAEEQARQRAAEEEEAHRRSVEEAANRALRLAENAQAREAHRFARSEGRPLLDLRVANLLQNNSQLNTFRTYVSDPIHRHHIPYDRQYQVATEMVELARRTRGGELSSPFISECLANISRTGRMTQREIELQDPHRQRTPLSDISSALAEMDTKKNELQRTVLLVTRILGDRSRPDVPGNLHQIINDFQVGVEHMITQLRTAANLPNPRSRIRIIEGESENVQHLRLPNVPSGD